MIREVELNDYLYTIDNLCDDFLTEVEAMESAKGLEDFLSDVKVWNDVEIKILQTMRENGLTKEVNSSLYDAYFDLCYYGDVEEKDFLKLFKLTEKELGRILM